MSMKRTSITQNALSVTQSMETTREQWKEGKNLGTQAIQTTTLMASGGQKANVDNEINRRKSMAESLPELQNRISYKRHDLNKDGTLDQAEVQAQLLKRPSMKASIRENGDYEAYERTDRKTLNRESFVTLEKERKDLSHDTLNALKNRPSYKRAIQDALEKNEMEPMETNQKASTPSMWEQ
jgi:hypothetical protein